VLDRAEYDRFRVSPVDPATIRVAHVEHTLAQLEPLSGGRLRVEKFAESFNGRPIYLATLGSGPKRVLLWSQMHGDEPTHTAVLLDLLSYLLRTPAEPFANEILGGCTLYMIPLLNPDGAERFSRFNAQDIDVNRDARRLATPEGRALRRAVETLKPDFAFNLHNQNARTAVGKPPKVAVASLLAPPPDEQRTETDSVRRAKQVAACFVNATRPDVDRAGGMLSKYDDTYEPRAFGDWVQSTGAATVLVEAGGWPATDLEQLVRLHFHGLLASLNAIATEKYCGTDPALYHALPYSNSNNLVDCLITGGQVLDTGNGTKFTTDIAINFAHGNRLIRLKQPDGKIAEVGDLSVLGARETINAANCVVLPGRVALVDEPMLGQRLESDVLDSLLSSGVTTVVCAVPAANRVAIERISSIAELPMNWGFLVKLDSDQDLSPELFEQLAFAVYSGALAIATDEFDSSTREAFAVLSIPLLELNKLPSARNNLSDIAQQSRRKYELFGLDSRRGRCGRDYVADLQLVDENAKSDLLPSLQYRVKRVLVAGETVWDNARWTGRNPGVFLRGR
jgi:hypothetical protein